MADADQAGHRLHVPSAPAAAAALPTQSQRLRLAFYLTAADGPARLQPLGIVQTLGVLGEVAQQTLRCLAAALAFLRVGAPEQLAHPGADPGPSAAEQQAATLLIRSATFARALAENAVGALAEVLAGVKEIERLHTAGQRPLHRLPDPAGTIGQGMHAGQATHAQAAQPRPPTPAKLLCRGNHR